MNNIWDLFLETELSYQVKSLCVTEQNIDSLIQRIALKSMNYLLEFIILSPPDFPPPPSMLSAKAEPRLLKGGENGTT